MVDEIQALRAENARLRQRVEWLEDYGDKIQAVSSARMERLVYLKDKVAELEHLCRRSKLTIRRLLRESY